MGFRPFYITILSGLLLILFSYNSSAVPTWFIVQAIQLTGINDIAFQKHLWSNLTALILLLMIPLFIMRFTEGWRPSDLGLSICHIKKAILAVQFLWLFMIPVIWYVASMPDFQKTYPFLRSVENNMPLFVYFELAILIKWIAWEFFFRGFMLFGLAKDMGGKAVLISTLSFAIMHIGKPEVEALSSIIAGFILCYIALRTKSIWPGVLLHWQVAMTMDFFTSSWWH